MLAAVPVGFLDGPTDLPRWVEPTQVVTPRPQLAELYLRQRSAFEQFYTATRPILGLLDSLRAFAGRTCGRGEAGGTNQDLHQGQRAGSSVCDGGALTAETHPLR